MVYFAYIYDIMYLGVSVKGVWVMKTGARGHRRVDELALVHRGGFALSKFGEIPERCPRFLFTKIIYLLRRDI